MNILIVSIPSGGVRASGIWWIDISMIVLLVLVLLFAFKQLWDLHREAVERLDIEDEVVLRLLKKEEKHLEFTEAEKKIQRIAAGLDKEGNV